MSDEKTPPPAPRDYSHMKVQSIPPDDPIFSEGLIITFPIRPSALASPPPETSAELPEGEEGDDPHRARR